VIVAPLPIDIHPLVAGFVRPVAARVAPVRVTAREAALDAALAEEADWMRSAPDAPGITAAVRGMYRAFGVDPTKTRPSSEALLRRVRKGEPLPRVNSAVDVINWCSLETRLPFGLYDADRIDGAVSVRLGHPGESYPGIRKDDVHVAGRLVVADGQGAFGNPTSDSLRTAVTGATTGLVIVVFAPSALAAEVGTRALDLTTTRLAQVQA
jgi:DNA/RNA-binding domain of Phe-tRNA-synthetase-like protein